jgi:sensor c-di-GMP phosphodiesterase-like protein
MRPMKIPFLARLTAIAVSTAVLGICGYFLGRHVGFVLAERLEKAHLQHAAEVGLTDSIAFAHDAHSALDGMTKSPYKPCSKQDAEYLHSLLHHAYLLLEVGRVQNERVLCSTHLERSRMANAVFPGVFSLGADGVRVYRDPSDFRVPPIPVTVLRKDDNYVVINPYINILRDRSQEYLFTTVLGPSRNPPFPMTEISARLNERQLTENGTYRVGDVQYVTQCSADSHVCITAALTDAMTGEMEAVHIRMSEIFGAILGAMTSILLSLEFRRSQGLKRQLRRAIRKDLIRVVYQPVVDVATGRVVAAEALSRWTDEDGTVIGPDIFIKVAEEGGFVGEITRLVLRNIVRDFAKTFREHPGFCVNMNVTSSDLTDPEFPNVLSEALERAHIAPGNLGIEITETGSVGGAATFEAIYLLQKRGHRVLIDDFGTGYSSLSYLHQLNVHTIKIDKSFTRAIGTEAVTVCILPQILEMADRLGLEVIAEGVETELQAEYYGQQEKRICSQGWHYGYPVPSEEIKGMVDQVVRPPERIPMACQAPNSRS